jgi:hypothetical protein
MSNLIFVRLAGGLGNQLFQLAAAQLLTQHNSRIFLMSGGLRRYKSPRSFDLDKLLNLAEINAQIYDGSKILSFICERLRLGRFPLIGVNDRNIEKRDILRRRGAVFMDGYFQDFWSDDLINATFSRLAEHINFTSIDEDNNACVVHIRGGDFLGSELYNITPISWYVSQANLVLKNHYVTRFCIISDDIKVATQLSCVFTSNFQLPVVVKVGRHLLEDFHTLRTASFRIIGNSTFALSAALAGGSGITFAAQRFDKNRIRNWRFSNEI